jgi:glycogen operon protein
MTALEPGRPKPAGAQADQHGINFSVFSAHATGIELCVFDDDGNEQRLPLPGRTGNWWHGFLPDGKPGLRYGFRASGPFEPHNGHRFNPHKLLLDPCARAVEGDVPDDPRLHGGWDQPDEQDSAAVAPKSVVVAPEYDWEGDAPLRTPWGQTVIYEAHVRGLTKRHPEIPEAIRGTYAALAHPVMIKHLTDLGITALELLPIQHFADEPRLQREGLSNYWGYNPLALYAVEPSYASRPEPGAAINEFRDAVKTLHQHGIEVILDIVFNHTAEIDLSGPTLSLRGLDNKSYYWLHDNGDYDNMTGCGNAIRLVDEETVAWAIGCMRYWLEECHVDGFRFDLAPIMGRTPAFSKEAPLFKAMLADPVISQCKLIAEPWDIGLGGYQLGNFPAPFAEWNDRFRDDVRRFWLQGHLPLGQFATRFSGSQDYFGHDGRQPIAAINMLTAHDGFTLQDTVSFSHKHNQANGEHNRDGTSENHSNNHGHEGLDADEAVKTRRRCSQRALLTTLLLAHGTPMLLAGDEQGQSQQGNNNAYCQDNELTWLDWAGADTSLTAFTAALLRLRRQIPALQHGEWWQDSRNDVQWLNGEGQPMTVQRWERGPQQRLQILLSGKWLLAINASERNDDIALPPGAWEAVDPFNQDENRPEHGLWHAPARALCVFARE